MAKLDDNLLLNYKEYVEKVIEFKKIVNLIFEQEDQELLHKIFDTFLEETNRKIEFIEKFSKK